MTTATDINALPVNQAVQRAFTLAGEPLHGQSPYVIEAMQWGVENIEWDESADRNLLYRMELLIGDMLAWDPEHVMAFLYPDTEQGGMHQDTIEEEASSLDGESLEDIALWLLETLRFQMD